MSPSYWSASKKANVMVETLPLPHARNALAKLNRGEYAGENGEPPGLTEELELREALEQRILDLESERAANDEAAHPAHPAHDEETNR